MCVLDIIHVCYEFPSEDRKYESKKGYWQRGGNASNSCTALRQLGAKCEFLGMLSSSPAFQFLQADCKQREIEIQNCPTTKDEPPFSSILIVETKGTRTIVHSSSDYPILTFKHFKKIDLTCYSWIHFEGRNPTETREMIDMIYRYNRLAKDRVTISVELERTDDELLILCTKVDVVILGKDMAMHQGWSSAREAVHQAKQLIMDMQLEEDSGRRLYWPSTCVICTWGDAGADCLSSDGDYACHMAAKVPKAVDTLGAGDTFIAGYIYGRQKKKFSQQAAVSFANKVAAYKVQRMGYDHLANFKL